MTRHFSLGVAEYITAVNAAEPDTGLAALTDDEVADGGYRVADELDQLALFNTDPYGRALMRDQAAAVRSGADALSTREKSRAWSAPEA